MGYSPYGQIVIGVPIKDLIQQEIEKKEVDILDEWSGNPTGKKKSVQRLITRFQGKTYLDQWEVAEIFNKIGLKTFYERPETPFIGRLLGMGKMSNDEYTAISVDIDYIKETYDKVKKIFDELGYTGEIKIYSMSAFI